MDVHINNNMNQRNKDTKYVRKNLNDSSLQPFNADWLRVTV